jgi:hypothetical protein
MSTSTQVIYFERDMVIHMQAQRREFPKIGGFCQMTTLTQSGVTQRITRRWTS